MLRSGSARSHSERGGLLVLSFSLNHDHPQSQRKPSAYLDTSVR